MPISRKLCIKLIIIYPASLSIAARNNDHFAKITGFHAAFQPRPDAEHEQIETRSHQTSKSIDVVIISSRLLRTTSIFNLAKFGVQTRKLRGRDRFETQSDRSRVHIWRLIASSVASRNSVLLRELLNVGIDPKAQRLPAEPYSSSRYAVLRRIGIFLTRTSLRSPKDW